VWDLGVLVTTAVIFPIDWRFSVVELSIAENEDLWKGVV
jgi:hypothetical protein